MRSQVCTFLCLWALFGHGVFWSASAASAYSRNDRHDGRDVTVLGNDFLELMFEPARGGRCVSFRFKDTGEQIIRPEPVSGMFIDHWAKYTWPSGLMWLPYRHEFVRDRKARVGVRLSVTVPPMGGGKGSASPESSAAIATSPDLVGLVVRKTIWLGLDSDLIEVEQEIENPTGESRSVASYTQHNLVMNGQRYHDTWYLPSTRGVLVNLQPGREGGKAIGPDWVSDPTAGWMAVRDRETGRGLVFAFDYNYVQKIYTCGQTAEWFMEAVPVGPGRTFSTRYVVKPVTGFEDFVYASDRVVADIRADEVDGEVRVQHDIAAVSDVVTDAGIRLVVTDWKTKERLLREEWAVARIGDGRERRELRFTPPNLANGVVLRVQVMAAGREECYERYYAGDADEHERRYGYFATKGGALAGTKGDAYSVSRPRKVKSIDKPDFSTVARPPDGTFRCLVVFGLYTQVLRIDEALSTWASGGEVVPTVTWANCPPNAVETFPGTYDELFSYHAVVLSDVNFDAVGDIGFEMICDYVEHGGGLLVTGGPYALGNGGFEGTRFLDVLPVTLSGAFDLTWAGRGSSWALAAADLAHPVLDGLSLAEAPRVFWQHSVVGKADADIVLRADGRPALVLGRYGRGKVAVWTPSPTGTGARGGVPWWEWSGWPALVRNTLRYLSE